MSNDLSLLVRNANPVPGVDHLSEDEFNAALIAIETALEEKPKRRRFSPFFQRLRQRPVIVFAAAMVIVALIVAIPIFLVPTPEGEVTEPTTVTTTLAPTTTVAPTTEAPPTTPPPPTTEATTTTTAAPAPPPPAISWTRLPDQPAFDEAVIGGWSATMIEGGPGLIAVGMAWSETGDQSAAMFVSGDGETWERIVRPFDEAGPFGILWDVAAGPDGSLVAVGADDTDAGVWVSSDGYAWSKVEADALGGRDVQSMSGVAAGGPGFVAVGRDGSNGGVWVSPDGYDWTKIEDEALVSGGRPLLIQDVVVGGPGLVAVGSSGFEMESDVDAVAWVSRDGYAWERLPVDTFDAESGNTGLQSLTVQPATGRLIAWGSEMWMSTDGYHWVVTERDMPFGGPPAGAEVAWNGNIAVAGGLDAAFSLWASGDAGANWSRIEATEPIFDSYEDQALAVAWFNDRWVVAGNAGAIWIGTPEE